LNKHHKNFTQKKVERREKETDRKRGGGREEIKKTKNHHPPPFVDLCYHFFFTLFQNWEERETGDAAVGVVLEKKTKRETNKVGFFLRRRRLRFHLSRVLAVAFCASLSASSPRSSGLLCCSASFFSFNDHRREIRNQISLSLSLARLLSLFPFFSSLSLPLLY